MAALVGASHCCELTAYGYSRDGKRGKARIEYGLLTDAEGRPVAVRVVTRNTGGPKTFPEHFILDIREGQITWRRDQASIAAEAATDGIYVIRTHVPAATLGAAGTVTAYKGLSRLERDFRSINADDLDLRPILHRLGDRIRAHVLICALACYLPGTCAEPGHR